MAWFPPIDAPTAALLGGVGGLIADNITGIIQRRLRRRNEEKDRQIEWYKTTIKIANEIKIFTVTHDTAQDIWASAWDETFPSEEEISETIDSMSIQEFLNSDVEINGIKVEREVSLENPSNRPISESDLPREETKEDILKQFEEEKFERIEEVRSETREDMEKYQIRLTEHLASHPASVPDHIHSDMINLLGICFSLSVFGEIEEDKYDRIHQTANSLIKGCSNELEKFE